MSSNTTILNTTSIGKGRNMSDDQPCYPRMDTKGEVVAKTAAYGIVFLMAVIGNILVVSVVHKSPTMRRKAINIFIVNLAVSDVLLIMFAVPRVVSELTTEQGVWFIKGIVGEGLCKLVLFMQDVSTAVSIQSIVVIAFDRFRAVVYPLQSATMSKKSRLLIIPLTWIVAGAIHSPYFFTFHLAVIDNNTFCIDTWSDDRQKHAEISRNYYLAMFCVFVVVPVGLLTGLYSIICCTLRRRGRLAKITTSIANSTSSAQMRRKMQEHNVLKMAMVIVIGFAICHGPFNTFVFLRIFVWDFWAPCNIEEISFLAPFLVYSNSAVNPILYFVFSENFRHGMRRVFSRQTSSSAKKNRTFEDKFADLKYGLDTAL